MKRHFKLATSMILLTACLLLNLPVLPVSAAETSNPPEHSITIWSSSSNSSYYYDNELYMTGPSGTFFAYKKNSYICIGLYQPDKEADEDKVADIGNADVDVPSEYRYICTKKMYYVEKSGERGDLANTNNYSGTLENIFSFSLNGDDLSTNGYYFESLEAAEAYFLDGDESGLLQEPEAPFDLNSFFLTGFECDKSVHASWTGVNLPDGYSVNDVSVDVLCGYMVILKDGESSRKEFEHPNDVTVPAAVGSYDCPLEDFYSQNPYDGQCILTLTFIPRIQIFKGKAITVTFDFDKNMDITLPDGALTGESSADLYFLNPMATSEFHNYSDSFIFFKWTGVSVENQVPYVSSNILIELYCHDNESDISSEQKWQWIVYDSGDIYSFKTRSIKFNLTDIETYVRNSSNLGFGLNNSEGNYKGEKIRITPVYRTGSKEVKGKPVTIELGTLGGVKSCIQDNLDGTQTDLDDNYGVSDVIDNTLDNILTDTDDLSFDVSDLGKIAIKFFSMIKTVFLACGEFPALLASVFVFLPSYYTHMLTIGLAVVIILRLLGR